MDNLLKSLRLPLAGALLWSGLLMTACVVPQNDEPLPAAPMQFANHRPQILLDTVTPDEFAGTLFVGAGCTPPEFKFSVADQDVGDQIRAAWRVSTVDGLQRSTWQIASLQNIGSTTVKRPEPLVPPLQFFQQSLLNSPGDNRRIDVVVTDTHFTTQIVNGNEVLQEDAFFFDINDGGVAQEPAGVDSFTWTLVVQNMNCQ